MKSTMRGIAALALLLLGPNLETRGFDRIGPKPVVIGEIAYLPGAETRPEGDKALFVRATIRAVDVRTDRELWTIPLRNPSPTPDPAIDDAIRTMTRFSEGILVRTLAGYYYVDPAARTSQPVEDHRIETEQCEVHQRALEDTLVPIHYGWARIEPGQAPDHEKLFPHAPNTINAGCLVREAKVAAIRSCPACRDASRASARRTLGEIK